MRNYIGQTIKKHKYDYVVITEVQSMTARLALSEKKNLNSVTWPYLIYSVVFIQ